MICPKCGQSIPINRGESYFDGNLLQLIGWEFVGLAITVLTLGICYPWAVCRIIEWRVNHTVVNGKRLKFDGTAIQLFGNWIGWWALCIITLGIYSLWLPVNMNKWETKHTSIVDADALEVSAEDVIEDKPVSSRLGWIIAFAFVAFLFLAAIAAMIYYMLNPVFPAMYFWVAYIGIGVFGAVTYILAGNAFN